MVHALYRQNTKDLSEKYLDEENIKKLIEFAQDVIKTLVINLIVIICGKYSNKNELSGRRNTWNASRVIAIVMYQFFDKGSVFISSFNWRLYKFWSGILN